MSKNSTYNHEQADLDNAVRDVQCVGTKFKLPIPKNLKKTATRISIKVNIGTSFKLPNIYLLRQVPESAQAGREAVIVSNQHGRIEGLEI